MDFYDKHINKGEIINSAYRRSFEDCIEIGSIGGLAVGNSE